MGRSVGAGAAGLRLHRDRYNQLRCGIEPGHARRRALHQGRQRRAGRRAATPRLLRQHGHRRRLRRRSGRGRKLCRCASCRRDQHRGQHRRTADRTQGPRRESPCHQSIVRPTSSSTHGSTRTGSARTRPFRPPSSGPPTTSTPVRTASSSQGLPSPQCCGSSPRQSSGPSTCLPFQVFRWPSWRDSACAGCPPVRCPTAPRSMLLPRPPSPFAMRPKSPRPPPIPTCRPGWLRYASQKLSG